MEKSCQSRGIEHSRFFEKEHNPYLTLAGKLCLARHIYYDKWEFCLSRTDHLTQYLPWFQHYSISLSFSTKSYLWYLLFQVIQSFNVLFEP